MQGKSPFSGRESPVGAFRSDAPSGNRCSKSPSFRVVFVRTQPNPVLARGIKLASLLWQHRDKVFRCCRFQGKPPFLGIVPMALDDSRNSLTWKLFEIPCNPERWISKGRFLDSACLSGCFPEKPYQNSKYWQSIYFCQSVGVLRCSIHGKSSSTLIYFNVPT